MILSLLGNLVEVPSFFRCHLTPTSASSSRSTVFNVVKMQTAMTMNTLGLGLGARPAMRSRVVAAKSAKAIVGTPVVGKPVQMAARRAAVTARAGGNPEPIVQAPFKGIQQDLAARGPLYIDDFKQGVSPKSLVSDQCFFAGPPQQRKLRFPRDPFRGRRSRPCETRNGRIHAKRPPRNRSDRSQPVSCLTRAFHRARSRPSWIGPLHVIPIQPPKLDCTGNFFFNCVSPATPRR